MRYAVLDGKVVEVGLEAGKTPQGLPLYHTSVGRVAVGTLYETEGEAQQHAAAVMLGRRGGAATKGIGGPAKRRRTSFSASTQPHRHRAAQSKTVGWDHCVVPGGCSGMAHGAVVHVETCACGAKRHIETNGRHQGRGPWQKE